MTGIADIAASLSGAQTTSGASTASQNMLNQQDFFRLMISQFQHQDPFKPMESGEFLGQIAQFSTVDGISQLNTSFAGLQSRLTSDQALAASNLIGREVLVPADTVAFDGRTAVTGRIEVPAGARRLAVDVVDAAGQTVRSLSVNDLADGAFTWDGRHADGGNAPAGGYRLVARAAADGVEIAAPVRLTGTVSAVHLDPTTGLQLEVAGIGPVDLDAVQRIASSN